MFTGFSSSLREFVKKLRKIELLYKITLPCFAIKSSVSQKAKDGANFLF
jgi:hypothetical protein